MDDYNEAYVGLDISKSRDAVTVAEGGRNGGGPLLRQDRHTHGRRFANWRRSLAPSITTCSFAMKRDQPDIVF
jgi:hypothetical protein